MKKPATSSSKRLPKSYKKPVRKYSLKGSELDLPMAKVLAFTKLQRKYYINVLLTSLAKEIKANRLSLKTHIYFYEEMADYRNILRSAPDKYLFVEDGTKRRWVLGKGAPGDTHVYWSATQIWKMETKQGSLDKQIIEKAPALVRKLDLLLDQSNKAKEGFRQKEMAIPCVLNFLQFDKSSGTAFPPFHARFLAHKYLPKQGDCIVFDPCAGWGGRLIGSLLVNRKDKVTYYGVDPEQRNQEAYRGLARRATIWLEKEIAGPREAHVFPSAFEDFIKTKRAKSLMGTIDFAITSPPYFKAENYNPDNDKQSANRYLKYADWVDGFYRPLIHGVFDLLKPGGYFALNVADVAEAPRLERDAAELAKEIGFHWSGFFKLAMSISPAQRKTGTARHVVTVDGKDFKHEPVFILRKPL